MTESFSPLPKTLMTSHPPLPSATKLVLVLLATSWIGACGGTEAGVASRRTQPTQRNIHGSGDTQASKPEQAPPSGPAKDIRFPPIAREKLANGLEINTVKWNTLPVVYLRLVIRSGGETNPKDRQGLSDLVAAMMKEGTRSRSSEALALDVERLGASIGTGSDEESLYVSMRALSQDLDKALEILGDVAMKPAFRKSELTKLKKRETDRLTLQDNNPGFLAQRAFHRELYGSHPYASIDTTAEVVKRVTTRDLKKWHGAHLRPGNAFLVAVGDIDQARLRSAAEKVFAKWSDKNVPAPKYAPSPERKEREIVLVDRPGSVQSVILIGNLALRRDDADYIPALVANQVLGGSAASRLFMDLREKRSLTYGAYSRFTERVDQGMFRAGASVRTEVTEEAIRAFDEHLQRIVEQPAPKKELENAIRYLSDRFPLQIDSPAKIASMVAELRIFGLADDYWDRYRSAIRAVTADQALAAAKKYIHPRRDVVVVVGDAKKIEESLRKFGKLKTEK